MDHYMTKAATMLLVSTCFALSADVPGWRCDGNTLYVELANNTPEGIRSTPIAANGRVYVRGLKNVYCIAGQ